jgi:hypothetical protein
MRTSRLAVAALFVVGVNVFLAAPAAATGTCPGKAQEIDLAAEQRDPGLSIYDANRDGTICLTTRGKKTVYSDNRG